MTALTGLDRHVYAFDFDGVMTDKGTARIGSDDGAAVDLTPLKMALEMGFYTGIMTCNVVTYVARVLGSHGIPALADIEMRYKVPHFAGVVLVSNRKLLADFYVDDHAVHYEYGMDPGLIFAGLKPAGDGCVPALPGWRS